MLYLLYRGIIAKQSVTRAFHRAIGMAIGIVMQAGPDIIGMVYKFGKAHFRGEQDTEPNPKSMRRPFMGLTGRDTNKLWTVTEHGCLAMPLEGKLHIDTRGGQQQYIKQPTELVTKTSLKLINLQAVQGQGLTFRIQTDMNGWGSTARNGRLGWAKDRQDLLCQQRHPWTSGTGLDLDKLRYWRPAHVLGGTTPVERVPCCPLSEKPRLRYHPPPNTYLQRLHEQELRLMNEA